MTQDDLSQASRSELIELALRQHHRVEALEQQLRWFQKQLFGARSERRIVEPNDAQLCLGEGLAPTAAEPVSETTVRSHVRRQRPPREPQDDPGLRFDDSVPVETIVIPNPEVEALPEESRSQISEKVSYRLAQRPGAYVVLKIVRPVVKRADTGALSCPPAPPSVLEKSYADVSLLAGMLVDKFRYHLPLYRQHQRIQAAGITLARASLTRWVSQAAELLAPIAEAQLGSIRESRVLAMDETPIRAARKAKGSAPPTSGPCTGTATSWPSRSRRRAVAPLAPRPPRLTPVSRITPRTASARTPILHRLQLTPSARITQSTTEPPAWHAPRQCHRFFAGVITRLGSWSSWNGTARSGPRRRLCSRLRGAARLLRVGMLRAEDDEARVHVVRYVLP